MLQMGRVFRAEMQHLAFDAQVSRLADTQYGLLSREQLCGLGVTKGMIQRRVAAGRWERMNPRVFRIAGAPESWRQSLRAATLGWGDGAVASHRSAAALWRLARFEPGPIELTVPRLRHRAVPVIVHRNVLFEADVVIREAIPVTTPARTLIDIASVCPPDAVEEAFDDALRRKMISIPRMRWRLDEIEGGGGRPGVSLMRSLVEARAEGIVSQSVLETRLLRVMMRAGIPKPVSQFQIRDGDELIAIVDFAFVAEKVAVEADGYRWHSGRIKWQDDLTRRNRITSLGWRVIHVTWDDLRVRPVEVIDSINLALGRSGT
jgi:very-short-patch-repair endonuclease